MKTRLLYLSLLSIVLFASCSLFGTKTPLEASRYKELTSYDKLIGFVNKLGRKSEYITVDTLAVSTEGRLIPYLQISSGEFGVDRAAKPIVLVFAQQHGDEPSGKEAVLALARDFSTGKLNDILEHLDILLVPQVNPDGAERHERVNARNVDLNRSHLILNAPETVGLRKLFHRWEPYVTLDVHEYLPWTEAWIKEGYIKLFDEQFGIVTNLNTAASLRLFAENDFLPYAEEKLTAAGYTFHNYLVGSPEAGIRYSTTNINDGRQGFGILNTLSFILEGKNGRTPTEDIRRRTDAQRLAIETLLRFCVERKSEIASLVRTARSNLLLAENDEFVMTMKRGRDRNPLRIPVLEVTGSDDEYRTGDTVVVSINNFFPLIVAEQTITMPDAYVIPFEERNIIDLMTAHNVLMRELEEGDVFSGEEYVIESIERRELENTEIISPAITVQATIYIARSGDMLVPTNQLQRYMIATALEPGSMHGLIQYNEFSQLRRVRKYPIVRVVLGAPEGEIL
jgi:hypothetical protein